MRYNERMGTQIAPATAEYIPISPESLEIANAYLATSDVHETATTLGIPLEKVTQYLARPEVKEYITSVYLDSGYRNRFKLAKILDKIVDDKLMELEEAGITSDKDIIDILQTIHKMKMEEIAAETARLKALAASPKKQTNIQINNSGVPATIFEKLMDTNEL